MPVSTRSSKLAAHDAAAAKILHGVQDPTLLAVLQALCQQHKEAITASHSP